MGGPGANLVRLNVEEEVEERQCAWQETIPNSVEWNLVSEILITKITLESDL